MEMVFDQQIPEGYATIRRSKGRKKLRTSSASSSENQFELMEFKNNENNTMSRKYDSDTLYNNHQNDIYDGGEGEVDEGVVNDIDSDVFELNGKTSALNYYCDSKRTFRTFKPNNPTNEDDGSDKDLTQSTDCFQTLPYDIIMSPLKSPQYINQLNALRTKTAPISTTASTTATITSSTDAALHRQQQFPLYARPDSPKYGKLFYNRSTSPSADSLDNCSSNSSTYSTNHQHHHHHTAFKAPNISTSLLNSHDDDNMIVINVSENNRKPPLKGSNLNYRKSFSHVSARNQLNQLNGEAGKFNNSMKMYEIDSSEYLNYEKPPICTNAMTKSFAIPSISTSQLYSRRFATLAHPKEKLIGLTNKSTSSLNDNHLIFWDPIMNCKIGSQTTLRTKPAVPWYELAIKKEHRQSCPPMQAHVVNAFEQSLTNMTNRLQQLTATTEKKESEITEMRQTIELLRKQSIQAGLTSAHIQSMGGHPVNGSNSKLSGSPIKQQLNGQNENTAQNGSTMQRHHSTDSMCSLNSVGSNCSSQEKKKKKGWLRSSFTKAFSRNAKISKTNHRQMSLTSNHNSDSKASLPPPTPQKQLQTNFPPHHMLPDVGKPPTSPTKSPHRLIPVLDNIHPITVKTKDGHPVVEDLKKQLREKDMVLTDIRLEALTQASQMETLKETVRTMRQEMMNLKQNNERLQRMVTSRSLAGSEASLGCPASPSGSMGECRRYSLATDSGLSRPPLELPQNLDETEEDNCPPAPAPDLHTASLSPHHSPSIDRISISNEILSTPAEDVADPVDGKRIGIAVFLGQSEAFPKFSEELNDCDSYFIEDDDRPVNGDSGKVKENGFETKTESGNAAESIIAYTYISGKTTWQNLDYIVRKTFKDYLGKIDPGTNLGLNTDSITSYHLGEAKRGPEMGFPELLPCGYIIGNVRTLYICLQGVGSLAFDSLIPRSIVHRYINLLTEHRRLILCGPSGTGKSYLARKLAEFLVARSNRSPAESIATFNVDHKSSKELQQYLGHIAEQASINGAAEELPSVIILDNLHHASALGDVFSCLLSAGPAAKLPCIIGTMSQATCNTTNLQLHHNFRWVLTANHMEPVKGFLGRYLRRRLFQLELQTHTNQQQMEKVFKWLPTVWQHINSFLETHSSSDVTIGPRLFLACPLDTPDSQVWFADVWNYHLAPYLVDAIREGVQLYGRRGGAWTDPCTYVRETYPWPVGPNTVPTLRQITAEDVGLEAGTAGTNDNQDPLLNMLMRLQEAANYNENQEQDSDCASLDSNFTHDSSAAADP